MFGIKKTVVYILFVGCCAKRYYIAYILKQQQQTVVVVDFSTYSYDA